MMSRRLVVLGFVLCSIGMLPACGGPSVTLTLPLGSSGTPSETSSSGGTERLLTSGDFNLIGATDALRTLGHFDTKLVTFTTSKEGRIKAVIDYTFASSELHILLFEGSCPLELVTEVKCPLAGALTTRGKPYVVETLDVPAGTYTLAIENFAFQTESGVYQITLTN
jgi:hypothetical protein